MGYRLAADLVLVLHTAFIAFVIFALLLTVAGWLRGWRWVRNRWFRGIHLVCIGYVIFEAWLAIACPLTVWEDRLRVAGGEEPYESGGFIAHWLHKAIFFHAAPWVFTTCYTAFGLLVVAMMVLAPPGWRRNSTTTDARLHVLPQEDQRTIPHMHQINDVIVREGKLVLSNLPFAEGQRVRVVVSEAEPRTAKTISINEARQLLKGGAERFDDPLEPLISVENWEGLE
jgi:hypothetical protein